VTSYDDRSGGGAAYGSDSTTRSYQAGSYSRRDYGDSTDPGGYSEAPTMRDSDFDLDEDGTRRRKLAWNSGADLGLLLLRLVAGGTFVVAGMQKIFGQFNGPGLDNFARTLSTQGGYRQANILATVTGFTEFVGGILLVIGLLTPLAAAALFSVMVNAVWAKYANGFFIQPGKDGYQYDLTLGAITAALALTGPGRVALDIGRAWHRRPAPWGWLLLVVGAAAAVAVRLVLHGL
jgi:putative oxidoreductase